MQLYQNSSLKNLMVSLRGSKVPHVPHAVHNTTPEVVNPVAEICSRPHAIRGGTDLAVAMREAILEAWHELVSRARDVLYDSMMANPGRMCGHKKSYQGHQEFVICCLGPSGHVRQHRKLIRPAQVAATDQKKQAVHLLQISKACHRTGKIQLWNVGYMALRLGVSSRW